jgi:L-ascorbate metabolism protein UlaG (beta-lactamase superfamily)
MGEAGIRLQSKDTVLLIDPPGAISGLKPTRQTAQVIAVTEKEGRDWSSVGGTPFVVDIPGEFEKDNAFVYGLSLPSDHGRVHFRIEFEDLSIGHLGSLDHAITNGELEQLEGVDILILPVGGKTVLTAEQAAEIINQVEPRIVIPIQYQADGMKSNYSGIEPFLKAFGAKTSDVQDKFKITKKELPADDTTVVLLSVS